MERIILIHSVGSICRFPSPIDGGCDGQAGQFRLMTSGNEMQCRLPPHAVGLRDSLRLPRQRQFHFKITTAMGTLHWNHGAALLINAVVKLAQVGKIAGK